MKKLFIFCLIGFLHITAAGATLLRHGIPACIVGTHTIIFSGGEEKDTLSILYNKKNSSKASVKQATDYEEREQDSEDVWINLNKKEINCCFNSAQDVPDNTFPEWTFSLNEFTIINVGLNAIEISQEGMQNSINITSTRYMNK